MKRPSITLRQWRRLRRSLCHITPAAPNRGAINFLTQSPAVPLTFPASRNEPSHTRRPFHNTHSQYAQRKAPAASSTKRKARTVQRYKYHDGPGTSDENGLFCDAMAWVFPVTLEQWLKYNMEATEFLYRGAIRDGYLPKAISSRTFHDVAGALYRHSFTSQPDGQFIRSISQDVDAVFRIGYCASNLNPTLREWIITACALAKARLPTVLLGARQVQMKKVPVRNHWIEQIEVLAREGYPPALVLQAKIAGIWNRFDEAFSLLEKKVLPYLSPSRRPPIFFEDIVLSGVFESPWRMYALLRARHDVQFKSKQSRLKSNEALRIAALVYQDAQALVEYASHMMNEGNLDMYEECMSKAATAGNSSACLFLANFYYLTFHGMYPTRGERMKQLDRPSTKSDPKTKAKPTPSESKPAPWPFTTFSNAVDPVYKWASSFFNQTMERQDYRQLAEDWYHLAYSHGEPRAAFMSALIARENGDMVEGRVLLDDAEKETDPDFQAKLQALKNRWYDKSYDPTLPRKMLEVQ